MDVVLGGLDTLKDQISKAVGNVDFAVITIFPVKDGKIKEQDPVTPAKSSTFSSLADMGAWDAATSLLKGAGSALLDKAKGMIGWDQDVKVEDLPPNTFFVQYNPASITFEANGALPGRVGRFVTDKGSKTPRRAKYEDFMVRNDVEITMGVDLIFEDIDNDDAFLANKLSPVDGELVTSLAKTAGKIAGVNKKHHSVRDRVQALNYLCRNSAVRRVNFSWGQTSLTGKVNSLKATYKMFSPAGEPIFATVHMDLQLLLGTGAVAEWDDIYMDSFGQGTGNLKARDLGVLGNIPVGDTTLGDLAGNVGAMINIPF